MKHCLTVFVVLLLCLLAAGAAAEKRAGEDFTAEDITDFYYTVSTSTYPPFYQRYRFYTEDGKKWFYHETREGGDWPQSEEDITVSGTVELTEADWAAFFACVRGGKADRRSEEILDGNSGPWMYIYWPGDEGEEQEFTFASIAEQFAFEALCARLAQNHVLTRFYISRGGYMVPQSYEITLQDGVYLLQENGGKPGRMDPERVAELMDVVQRDSLEAWDGFHGSNPDVLDGEGFCLEMTFADGTNVFASGENAFPDSYHDATASIDAILEKEKMARLAGTYLYEGEGFGGDFTITLKPDGTYTWYEGYLSSYIGTGTWDTWYNEVFMTESGETGYDLRFMFGVEEDALVYLRMNSDDFMYVKVSDGERFVRQARTEEGEGQ